MNLTAAIFCFYKFMQLRDAIPNNHQIEGLGIDKRKISCLQLLSIEIEHDRTNETYVEILT